MTTSGGPFPRRRVIVKPLTRTVPSASGGPAEEMMNQKLCAPGGTMSVDLWVWKTGFSRLPFQPGVSPTISLRVSLNFWPWSSKKRIRIDMGHSPSCHPASTPSSRIFLRLGRLGVMKTVKRLATGGSDTEGRPKVGM